MHNKEMQESNQHAIQAALSNLLKTGESLSVVTLTGDNHERFDVLQSLQNHFHKSQCK